MPQLFLLFICFAIIKIELFPFLQEKLLHTMVATEDEEEVEILKARFDTFDNELKSNADKVSTVGTLSRQLLNNDHPDSDRVIERQKQLGEK